MALGRQAPVIRTGVQCLTGVMGLADLEALEELAEHVVEQMTEGGRSIVLATVSPKRSALAPSISGTARSARACSRPPTTPPCRRVELSGYSRLKNNLCYENYPCPAPLALRSPQEAGFDANEDGP
jgi:hypothetical protein